MLNGIFGSLILYYGVLVNLLFVNTFRSSAELEEATNIDVLILAKATKGLVQQGIDVIGGTESKKFTNFKPTTPIPNR